VYDIREISINIQKVVKKTVIDKRIRELSLKDSREAYKLVIGQELSLEYNIKFINKEEELREEEINYYILPEFLEATWLG